MRRLFILSAVVVAALGVWSGVRAYQSPSVMTEVQAGLAIFFGCNLLFGVWLWRRAAPGSGDAMILPAGLAGSASMLVAILPRLFWPSASGLHLAGSTLSLAAVATMWGLDVRRRRRLRRGVRPSL